ncbi:CLUMA_CG006231, isoform A [Clunio marinus]|uniref:CLUMA_CG006231, isoform A n=1 Tax=Clunio marinus TaxID=568069 RepID=A0A1J1HXA4_9DIPT|nr:CLUMA_CG006231, isoform A [Clunio marinus]
MENSNGSAVKSLENGNLSNGEVKTLETSNEKRKRTISLIIIYFTLFLQSLGLAIAMTGVWPFLDKLDPHAGKPFFSLILAANPLGQFILSPILGYWTNKVPSIRIPIITSLVMFCVSSGLYSSLDLIESGVKFWMLVVRFFMGAASANVAVCRSYIAAATKLDERTFALSMASLAQVSGFIVGPLLQAAFTLLGDGIKIFKFFPLSMYTAPGWVNVILGALNIVIFLPQFFQDHNIAVREQMLIQGKENAKETWKSTKIDYLVAWSLIFSYFIVAFNLVILESLGTPLTMEQFAFTKKETLKWNGILVGVGALISCIIFCLLPRLCRIFREIDILIWGGLLIMTVGKFVYIPFRTELPQLSIEQNFTMENGTVFVNSTLGCPVVEQPWCEWTPRLGIPEFVVGYFMGVIGYPVGVTLIQTLFSKILGSRPQGTWMGIMLAAGSMSRIIGPVIIVGGYTKFGTIWTFSVTTIVMIIPIVLLYMLRNRVVGNGSQKIENPNNINMTDVSTQQPKG